MFKKKIIKLYINFILHSFFIKKLNFIINRYSLYTYSILYLKTIMSFREAIEILLGFVDLINYQIINEIDFEEAWIYLLDELKWSLNPLHTIKKQIRHERTLTQNLINY